MPLVLFGFCLTKKYQAWECAYWIDKHYRLEDRVSSAFFLIQEKKQSFFSESLIKDAAFKLREVWNEKETLPQENYAIWQGILLCFCLLFFFVFLADIKSLKQNAIVSQEQKIALENLNHSIQALSNSEEKDWAEKLKKISVLASGFSAVQNPEKAKEIASYSKEVKESLDFYVRNISQNRENRSLLDTKNLALGKYTLERNRKAFFPDRLKEGIENDSKSEKEREFLIRQKEMALQSALNSLHGIVSSFSSGSSSSSVTENSREAKKSFDAETKQKIWEKIQGAKEKRETLAGSKRHNYSLEKTSLMHIDWPKKYSNTIQKYFMLHKESSK